MRHAVALALSLLAATPPPQTPQLGETIEVSIVNVDVFVTDRRGNRVRGLTRNDFEIFEDGRPQPITNFSEFGSRRAPADDGTIAVEPSVASQPASTDAVSAEAIPAPRRTILLFLDRFRLPSFKVEPVFDALRKAMHALMRPGDRVLVASWTGRLYVRQEPTDDVARVDELLAQIERESSGVTPNPAVETLMDTALAGEFEREVFGASGGSARRTVPPGALDTSFGQLAAAHEQLLELRDKTDALTALMTSVAGNDGKKILLMATRSYGAYAGAEFFGGMVPPKYQGELDTRELRKHLTDSANANGVTIYPIYPPGIGSTFPGSAELSGGAVLAMQGETAASPFAAGGQAYDQMVLMNQTTSLSDVARATGGLMAWGAKDIVELLPRVVEDVDSYYSLGYRATAKDKDRVRNIDVRAKNREYVVRSRRAVVEKSTATRVKDRVIAALYDEVNVSDAIPLSVAYGTASKRGGKWLVPLQIRVPISALTTIPGPNGHGGGFSVFIVTGGTFGTTAELTQKTQPFNIPERDLARAKSSHFTYAVDVVTDGRADHLAVAVLDELSKEVGIRRLELPPSVVRR